MGKLRSRERELVRQLQSFTQANEKTCIYCLQKHNWRLELAVDQYFSNPAAYHQPGSSSSRSSSSSGADSKKIKALYEKYKDPSEPGKIGLEGVEKLCNDLELDPVMLVDRSGAVLATKSCKSVRIFAKRILRRHGKFTRR